MNYGLQFLYVQLHPAVAYQADDRALRFREPCANRAAEREAHRRVPVAREYPLPGLRPERMPHHDRIPARVAHDDGIRWQQLGQASNHAVMMEFAR